MILTKELAQAAVYGGLFYGGGGGGYLEDGLRLGASAFEYAAPPELLDIDEIAPDATLMTVAVVGAPAERSAIIQREEMQKTVDLMRRNYPGRIDGIISNELGAVASINGWVQAAYAGVPVIDAPANGRAQPTAIMGSMGLNELRGYESLQSVAGGNAGLGTDISVFIRSPLGISASSVRHFSSFTGGMVCVLRNPVSASYVKQNAAPGAIKQSIRIGQETLAGQSLNAVTAAERIAAAAGGFVVDTGVVKSKKIASAGGFDNGLLTIETADGTRYSSVIWNEYLNLDAAGRRLAAFPDLVTFFDMEQRRCLISAEIKAGDRVAMIVVPRDKLLLGRGVLIAENLTQVDELLRAPAVC